MAVTDIATFEDTEDRAHRLQEAHNMLSRVHRLGTTDPKRADVLAEIALRSLPAMLSGEVPPARYGSVNRLIFTKTVLREAAGSLPPR